MSGNSAKCTPCNYPGLVTHLNWALGLDERQAENAAGVMTQWKDPREGEVFFNSCESMAERKFALGFMLEDGDGHVASGLSFSSNPVSLSGYSRRHCRRFSVAPQAKFGGITVDFVVWNKDYLSMFGMSSVLVVEIDGHDWHEKSREQASSDRARDRSLAEKCVAVIRFTGSDVNASPAACAAEAVSIWSARCAHLLELRHKATRQGMTIGVHSTAKFCFNSGRSLQRRVARELEEAERANGGKQ